MPPNWLVACCRLLVLVFSDYWLLITGCRLSCLSLQKVVQASQVFEATNLLGKGLLQRGLPFLILRSTFAPNPPKTHQVRQIVRRLILAMFATHLPAFSLL